MRTREANVCLIKVYVKFPGAAGEPLFMNCNKKSHFDGVTPVHRRMGEEVGRWGGVGGMGGEKNLVMSLFARRRCSHRS